METRKAAKLREFKVFSHCTPTVLHVVAEISHGKESVFFQLIPIVRPANRDWACQT